MSFTCLKKRLIFVSIGLCYALIMLNPYFTWGRPGYVALLSLWLIGFILNAKLTLNVKFWLDWLTLLTIGAYSSLVAIFFGVVQISVLFALASMFLLFHATIMWSDWLNTKYQQPMVPFYASACVVVLNSVLILLQILVPEFQGAIEKYFVPADNIDFSQGFRFRGMASTGGAGLSVMMALGCIILLFEKNLKFINPIIRLVSAFLIIITLVFVGRTGIALLVVGIIAGLLLNMRPSFIMTSAFSIFIFMVIGYFFWDHVSLFVEDRFEPGVLKYALGFLDGREGLENEGSLPVLISYLMTFPDTISSSLFGTGFYGGNQYSFYSDSGVARVFLAVGYPVGLLLYFIYIKMLTNGFRIKNSVFFISSALLFIAEMKEPLLFIGPAARLLAVYAICLTVYDNKALFYSRKSIRLLSD